MSIQSWSFHGNLTIVKNFQCVVSSIAFPDNQRVCSGPAVDGVCAERSIDFIVATFGINDVVEGDSSNTLASLGIVTGDEFLCKTKQSGTKEQRQKQKLDIAAAKRNDTYDITQLPTQYDGNDVVDNANSGGLVAGRPWTA